MEPRQSAPRCPSHYTLQIGPNTTQDNRTSSRPDHHHDHHCRVRPRHTGFVLHRLLPHQELLNGLVPLHNGLLHLQTGFLPLHTGSGHLRLLRHQDLLYGCVRMRALLFRLLARRGLHWVGPTRAAVVAILDTAVCRLPPAAVAAALGMSRFWCMTRRAHRGGVLYGFVGPPVITRPLYAPSDYYLHSPLAILAILAIWWWHWEQHNKHVPRSRSVDTPHPPPQHTYVRRNS